MEPTGRAWEPVGSVQREVSKSVNYLVYLTLKWLSVGESAFLA